MFPPTPDDLQRFYADGHEDDRLRTPKGELEYLRTAELIGRYLPPPPAVILDVGGGTGRYARMLSARGYAVHLLDAVPLHIELARVADLASSPLASMTVGDACTLPFATSSADAMLLLGPLYHL